MNKGVMVFCSSGARRRESGEGREVTEGKCYGGGGSDGKFNLSGTRLIAKHLV